MNAAQAIATDAELLAAVRAVPDPEIPVLTLGDLGIIRFLSHQDDAVIVGVAPTYSACPATESRCAAAGST